MANEATLIVQYSHPVNFTVADGTGIEKGAILTMSDPMTAATCTTDNAIVAGIAAAEKIASDGVTKLAVFRDGIFKVTLSGSAAVGDPLATSALTGLSNTVHSVLNVLLLSGSKIIGTALETGTTGETILMELRPSFCVG